MDTFTFYPGRSWVVRALGRNPLLRMSDRVEALVLILAFAAMVVVTPLAGAIGTAVHDSRAQLYAEEARTRHPVAATVTEDPTSTVQENRVTTTAPVQWSIDGIDHRGELEVAAATKSGDRVQVWVDREGRQVGEPPSQWRAGADALFVGAGLWLAMVACVAGSTAWARAVLARRRDLAWERDLTTLIDDGGGRTGSQT